MNLNFGINRGEFSITDPTEMTNIEIASGILHTLADISVMTEREGAGFGFWQKSGNGWTINPIPYMTGFAIKALCLRIIENKDKG